MEKNVSIPEAVLLNAEETAKELGVSLSEFCTTALKAYIKSSKESSVTRRLNEVYENESSSLDPGLMRLQMLAIGKEEW